jgi:hypothetical protein
MIMGFRIEIDKNTQRLLGKLRTSPIEIFEKAYAGYLLFLFGGADENVLTWFSRHVVALDSLTGEHVAFVIFASQVPIKLRTGEKKGETRRLGQVELSSSIDQMQISRLVKSGQYGYVYDGDEIVAITYATDAMARAFGVVNELPCLLILDGLPRKDVQVVHLSQQTVEDLIPTLRKAIHSLEQHPSLHRYLSILERIAKLQKDRASQTRRLEELVAEAENASDQNALREKHERFGYLDEFRSEGQLNEFAEELSILAKFGTAFEEISSQARQDIATLVHYDNTSLAVQSFLKKSWPLAGGTRARYQKAYEEHVRLLVSGLPEQPDMDSRTACQELVSKLGACRQELADRISRLLPSEREYLQAAKLSRESRLKILAAKIRECRLDITSIDEALAASVKECISKDQPSLSRIVSEVLTGKHLKTRTYAVVDAAKAFAGQVLKPDTLLKIWGLMHGSE